jgi:hypothetical protein
MSDVREITSTPSTWARGAVTASVTLSGEVVLRTVSRQVLEREHHEGYPVPSPNTNQTPIQALVPQPLGR